MADPVSIAITVALNAATMAMTMLNKVEGPRLNDLTVSTADYGTPLPQFYGTKRLELPCFYAEQIREEKHTTKGKGGKYAQYEYFGTWASFVADHEIADKGCLKLWFDRHLVFDRTDIRGPLINAILGPVGGVNLKLKVGRNIRFHEGTETQSPDPRMLSKIEHREGAGMCPAYLGVAYIMFEDIPLEKFGNRLPQVSGVFVRPDPEHLFPFERVPRTDARLNTEPRFSRDRTKLLAASGNLVDMWVLPSLSRISDQVAIPGASPPFGVLDNGNFYAVEANFIGGGNVYLCSPFGGSQLIVNGRTDAGHTHTIFAGCEYVGSRLCIYTAGLIQESMGSLETDSLGFYIHGTDPGFCPTHFFEDAEGSAIAVGRHSGEDAIYFASAGATDTWKVPLAEPPGNLSAMDNGLGQYVVYADTADKLYLVDIESRAITKSLDISTIGFPTIMGRTVMAGTIPGAYSLWFDNHEISTEDLTILRTINFNDWCPDLTARTLYDPYNHALISEPNLFGGTDWTWRFLDRDGPTGTTLGDICTDVALQAGMLEQEFDFTDLDQIVLGYSWTQGPAKEVVGALLEVHDSDIRPHGFIQQGLKRGQPLSGPPITSDWFVPDTDGAAGTKPLWRVPITAETDLPREVFATFADPNMDEQPNTARTARPATTVKTKRAVSFDLQTLSIEPEDMQALLDRSLRRYWVGAVKPECRVTPLEMKIEPGDVRFFFFEEEPLRCKVVRTNNRANRVIDLELEVDGETPVEVFDWELDEFSPLNTIYSTPGAVTGGRPPDEVFVPVPTKGFLLDVALLRDTDDQTSPLINTAAARDFSGFWPGATVWVSDDNEADSEFEAGWDDFSSDQSCTWGVCTSLLPDALTSVIDNGSELEVFLPNDDPLSSITEDAMLESGSANLAVIGDEVVQFMNADQIGTGRYLLSGFVRGARGSERNTGSHAIGERFVLIDADVHSRTVGASEIGDTDYYRFASYGLDPVMSETIALTFAANAHRPLAPAHLELVLDSGTGDWSGTFVRRTRVGGSALNGQDVPLGESSESYRIKVLDPADLDADPVRTIETTDPEFTYSAAQQTADFGTPISRLVVDVCQMSPTLSLEGFPTRGDES